VEAGAQVLFDRLGFGRRFHDDERLGHQLTLLTARGTGRVPIAGGGARGGAMRGGKRGRSLGPGQVRRKKPGGPSWLAEARLKVRRATEAGEAASPARAASSSRWRASSLVAS